jgi:hypothetical protein
MTRRDDIIRAAGLEPWVLPGREYPHPLPDEVVPFYCYTRDGGHSLLVVLENEYQDGQDPERFIIPAPVRAVLRAGYHLTDGLLWCTLAYERDSGLVVEEGDREL